MFPRYHILVGFLVSLSLYILGFSLSGSLIVFLSSFLIDLDHYLYYVVKTKSYNPFSSLKWFKKIDDNSKKIPKNERKNFYSGVYFLHGIEALVILIVLSLFYKPFFFIFLGFVVHQILDLIEILVLGESPDKLLSFFYFLYRKRYKKPYLIIEQ